MPRALAPSSEVLALEQAVAAHDRAVAARGLDIWLGNEPTFTRRESNAPEWVTEAVGREKREHAIVVLRELARAQPGGVVLRCVGRRYPGETEARFSLGLYAKRNGEPVFDGPPDPCLTDARGVPELAGFHAALGEALEARGWAQRSFRTARDRRTLFAFDAAVPLPSTPGDARLLRESIHGAVSADAPTGDALADDGLSLLVLRGSTDASVAELELPKIREPEAFARLLAAVAEAARAARLPSLVLCGFPPPVSAEVSFLTLTPDPAVLEVNMPPYASVTEFLEHNRRAYAAAARAGLSAYRLRYNGVVADSGGGGQITFGGPSPLGSPFLRVPELLPRLLRYTLRHPVLSYGFAHDYVGASGQSVRPDEQGLDALAELRLALALLERAGPVDPVTLWRSLAPCLTDPSGNLHRAELNVEKLWNPADRERGELGLVELRALRMQATPERAAALATLLRAVIAMLMTQDYRERPPAHGALLHDRFALPFFLDADLAEVLADLERAGLGLGAPLEDELRRDGHRHVATVEFEGVTLTIRRGLEFWPLLGDVALQQGSSRLVDSSTARLELVLRASSPGAAERLLAWELRANGRLLPLRAETEPRGPARVFGVRYRSFRPAPGLHPTLDAQSPLVLTLSHPTVEAALEVTLHDWLPGGGAYERLPRDLEEAAARRADRCRTRQLARAELGPAIPVLPEALSAYSLDLRYPPAFE